MKSISKRVIPFAIIMCFMFVCVLLPNELMLKVTRFLKTTIVRLLGFDKNNYPSWALSIHRFRTLLHIPCYILIGLAAGYWQHGKNGWLKAFMICAAIAIMDETIKILIPSRDFGFQDLLYDLTGILIGTGITFLLRFCQKRIRD